MISSLAQWVKDPMLLWCRLQLWGGFDPWSQNFSMPWVWPLKRKKTWWRLVRVKRMGALCVVSDRVYFLPPTGVVRCSQLPEVSWSADPVPACNSKQRKYAWARCQLRLPAGFQKGRACMLCSPVPKRGTDMQEQKVLQGPGLSNRAASSPHCSCPRSLCSSAEGPLCPDGCECGVPQTA